MFLYADDVKLYNNILNNQDKNTLQNDFIKLKSWADNWFINLDMVKYKEVSFSRKIDNTYHFSINDTKLENVESFKDLCVTFAFILKFGVHTNETVNKAYNIPGVITRNFTFLIKKVVF